MSRNTESWRLCCRGSLKKCLLLRQKRTWAKRVGMSASDPKADIERPYQSDSSNRYDVLSGGGMRRRDFIGALAGVTAAPLTTRAQQPPMPVIGFLSSASPGQDAGRLRGFRQGLSESGYIEGRNVVIEYRWAEEQNDRLPAMAADLVRRPVSVIVQSGQIFGALAAQALTKTIPIVFLTGGDPVALGLVDSLNRPGGNVTGVVSLSTELEPKKLELLRDVIPNSKIIGVLINNTNPFAQSQSSRLQQAGDALGLTVQILNARVEDDFEAAFAKLAEQRVGGLVIANDGLFNSKSEKLAARPHAMHFQQSSSFVSLQRPAV